MRFHFRLLGCLLLAIPLSETFSGLERIALASAEPMEWRIAPRKASQQNPYAADKSSLALGQWLYQRECLSCHGVTGKGDGPAAAELERSAGDLSSQATGRQSDGELFWKITLGRKPMPSFKTLITNEERWHVVNYLRTLSRTAPEAKRSAR